MLKGGKKSKFKEIKFEMTPKTIKLFEKLKCYFQMAPMLVYFDPIKYSMLETNASDETVEAIFLQLIQKTS